MSKIYIHAKSNDGTAHFRAVQADHVTDSIYLIVSQPYNPAIETWEFPPGTKVKCEPVVIANKTFLLAAETAN